MIEFITHVLFESLPWLVVFCLVALAVALAVHRSRGTPASRRGIWIVLAVSVGLVVMQRLVVTDREALETAVRSMALAVDEGNVAGIAEYLDEGFQLGSGGREEFIQSATRTLEHYQVDEPRIFAFKTQVDGDSAVVSFSAFCDVRRGGDVQYNFPTRWELHFVRRTGRWLLDRINRARWELPIGNSGGGDIVPYFR